MCMATTVLVLIVKIMCMATTSYSIIMCMATTSVLVLIV